MMDNPFDAPAGQPIDEFNEDFGLSGEKRERAAHDVAEPATRAGAIITEPGFYPDVTPDQYFAEPCPAPALTNSGIQMIAPVGSAPAKFAHHHPAIGQPAEDRKSTAAQYRGSLVHRLALGKGKDFVVSPYDAYRSNEAKEWRDSVERAGKMPVKQADMEVAAEMADRIRPQIEAACQGHPYQTEVVVAWREDVELTPKLIVPIWCRAMLDVWCPAIGLALDVKTCRGADDDTITKAFNNGYAIQDAWYLRGVNALADQTEKGRARFGFLFVESEAPFLDREVAASEGYRHAARMMIERARWVFARCLHHNDWPGYEPLRPTPSPWFVNQCEAAMQDS